MEARWRPLVLCVASVELQRLSGGKDHNMNMDSVQ